MLLVKIKNLNKNNISEGDWFSKNDMYVKVTYGSEVRRTTVRWDNDMPVWDETFLFDNSVITTIKFELYDSDKWSPDELLTSFEYVIDRLDMKIKSVAVGDVLNIEIGGVFTQKKHEYGDLLKKKIILDTKLEKIQEILSIQNEEELGINLK